ncbi:hypothetical protein [Desulfotignum phosphitoxidans]|uniref:Uncharacterized protein n=1 Tax=Desulfotignum phosphitoxidans DSM 13687 TaxID=1286635 RepID=S0G3G0_9BACT|nr:hypothetical protein [Desulfotignum phosphitoxidans]EMS81445.1 hypothetical protein Dpo_1c05860 [Desulfotignum phosphitoxidans DSM 13687]
MIKLTISEKLEPICDFIDNRLVLIMAEKKLRQLNLMGELKLFFKEEYKVKIIDNTVLYLEKNPQRISLTISTIEKKGDKPKTDHFGVSITNKNDSETEFYIDTLNEAFKKGILSIEMKKKVFTMKIVGYAFLAILLLSIISVTGGLAFIGLCILAIIISPIQYLLNKRMFKKTQQKMETLVSIFEEEFNVINKTNTNDWISFWGQVKSDIKDEVKTSLPFSYR